MQPVLHKIFVVTLKLKNIVYCVLNIFLNLGNYLKMYFKIMVNSYRIWFFNNKCYNISNQ